MAEKKASLIIQLRDEASKGLASVGETINKFKGHILAATAALTAIGAAAYSFIKEAMAQETAVNKLNVSMKNNGSYTLAASKDLQGFANELQRTTTIGDETALEMMSLLGTFGLTGEKLKEATMAAADLSKGLGIDLNSAALLVGKSFVGETSSLSRYGITIDEGIPKTQKFTAVMEQLNQRFGGAAAAEMNTTAGRIANLKNAFSDVKEELGFALLPAFEKLVGFVRDTALPWFQNVAEIFSTMSSNFALFKMAFLEHIAQMVEGLAYLIEQVPGLSFLFEKMGIDVESMAERVRNAINSKIAVINQGAVATAAANEKKKTSDNTYTANKVKNNQTESLDEQKKLVLYVAAQAKAFDAKKKMEDDALANRIAKDKREQEMNEALVASWSSALGRISSLSGAKNKELVMLGKAAAIAQIAIDTQVGAMKAFGQLGMFGGPAAGLIYAAGAVAAAKVAGVNLAEGGMVMPRNGGVSATIAEAGSAEAVIPLDDPDTKEKLADVMGGSTINISAGTIIADNMSVREFARKIDEELFQLQRNRQTVSI